MTATTTAPEAVLKVREVAHHLNCDEDTVYRLIREGRLPALRLGAQSERYPLGRVLRVPESALAEFIAGR
ncbi:MAG: helix-turn-helix domain-containing protein [Nocardioides sp.]|nr:helix-turn-helix domain-containing protein [Nocardioides sp.]